MTAPAQEGFVFELYDNDTDEFIGTINSSQLKFMIDQLEEESSQDKDYYINVATLDMFESRTPQRSVLHENAWAHCRGLVQGSANRRHLRSR